MGFAGLGEELHRILKDIEHRIPGYHAETLKKAGDVLKGNTEAPAHWTNVEGYKAPTIPEEDRKSGQEFEDAAAAEVAQDAAADDALLGGPAEDPAVTPAPDPVDISDSAPSIGDEGKAADPTTAPDPATTASPTPSISSEAPSGASSTP
jgi:hypothetical protein